MNFMNRILILTKTGFAAATLTASLGALAVTNWSVGDFLDGTSPTTLAAQNISAWSTGGTTDGSLRGACIHNYGSSGYGVVNLSETSPCSGEPGTGPHAADNVGGVDLFQLTFASKVDLESVKIGWNGTDNYGRDSDISILAYTGPATTTTPNLSGKTLAQLLTSGWSLVGHYGNVGSNLNNTATITSTISSSWWLVSAYSSNYGTSVAEQYQTCKNSNGTNICGGGNDYFKLMSVAGNVSLPDNKVPEPGSLALAAAGLLGMLGVSRQRKAPR